MSKNYDMIATVDIDIATPIVDDTSFDNLLIMGPAPKTGAKSPARVGVYSDISEVEDAGLRHKRRGCRPRRPCRKRGLRSESSPDGGVYRCSAALRRRCCGRARPSRTPILRSRSMRARKRALPAAPSPSRSLPQAEHGSGRPHHRRQEHRPFRYAGGADRRRLYRDHRGHHITDGASFKACPVWSRLKKIDKGDEEQFTVEVNKAGRYCGALHRGRFVS